MTPSTSRPPSPSIARARWVAESAREPATSNDSSTRESAVFTDCPPGPDDRLKRHRSSDAGIAIDAVTCRGSSMGTASVSFAAQGYKMGRAL